MLSNTGYKLIHEKKLTIGFFGGSITEAKGQNSYRERLNTWFRESYPEAEVVSVSAAIGGTGTQLGMYRCDRDLNAHHPDLVFFEFAVNDCSEQYEAVAEQTETIFRLKL